MQMFFNSKYSTATQSMATESASVGLWIQRAHRKVISGLFTAWRVGVPNLRVLQGSPALNIMFLKRNTHNTGYILIS